MYSQITKKKNKKDILFFSQNLEEMLSKFCELWTKVFVQLQVNLIVQLDYLALYHISYCIGFHSAFNFARYCTRNNNNAAVEDWGTPSRHFAVVYLAWPHATLVHKVFSDFQISVFGHKFMRHQFSLWTEAAEGTEESG